jgi:hypothetical protein
MSLTVATITNSPGNSYRGAPPIPDDGWRKGVVAAAHISSGLGPSEPAGLIWGSGHQDDKQVSLANSA